MTSRIIAAFAVVTVASITQAVGWILVMDLPYSAIGAFFGGMLIGSAGVLWVLYD